MLDLEVEVDLVLIRYRFNGWPKTLNIPRKRKNFWYKKLFIRIKVVLVFSITVSVKAQSHLIFLGKERVLAP